MDIEHILDKISSLSESSKLILKSHITDLNYPKNYVIIQQDTIENDFYFIKKKELREHLLLAMVMKLHFHSEKRAIPLSLSKVILPIRKDTKMLNCWKIVHCTNSIHKTCENYTMKI
ncbi:hypothetical protein J3D55_002360 [Chryseobacterium ginsenosidimutans]|nr:hypothetical protein [Chryseobacterium ginsenosidimutans]